MTASPIIAAPITAGPRLKVVQPGEGHSGGLVPGIGVQFKLDGADTLGALSIVEHPFAVGALVPPHIHHREDEFSIVTEGRIGFRSNDQEVVLEAGGYIVKPRGEVHAMWNAGRTPARMIEIIAPAGFEAYFREIAAMTATGVFDWAVLERLSVEYALPFVDAAWLPDVIARYGLTPPPAPPVRG
ncbi:MAG: cupin domain-containing protein [Chloroflexota bacterium]